MKMKSVLALVSAASLASVLSSTASAAGGWVLAADSAKMNTRYLVDTSQFDYSTNKHGVPVFGIPVRSVSDGVTENGYAVIDATSCADGGGDMAVEFRKDRNRYWWSIDGSLIYDLIGASICKIGAAQIEATQTKRKNAANSESDSSASSKYRKKQSTEAQVELEISEFAKRKPKAVFETVRNTMADVIDLNIELNNALTLDQAYVTAVNIHYTVTAETYKSLGLSEGEYKLLSLGESSPPSNPKRSAVNL